MSVVEPRFAQAQQQSLETALFLTASGDRIAFRRLYDLTAAKLFGVCLRICGERQAAEDVLQEVYLVIWRRAAGYEPRRGQPMTWLATIARHRALDWRRSSAGRHVVTDVSIVQADHEAMADDAPLADHMLIDAEEHDRLRLCMEELDDRPRHAIRSAFVDGLTYAEVAERAAVPLATMKSLIRRALIRLRECLRDDA